MNIINKLYNFLCRRQKKKNSIKIENSNKNLEVQVLLQDGFLFISSAQYLFSHPFFMYSAAVLSHHGIELSLKACQVWDKDEYTKTHSLPVIANKISFLNANRNIQDLISKIDTFYHFRYPMDSNVRDTIQKTLDRIEDNIHGIPTSAGEIGTFDWESVDHLYQYIIGQMPEGLYRLWDETTNQYRNLLKEQGEI